jgi:hypothetical protein
MEAVKAHLRQSLRMERSGARVITRDEHTLILVDLPEWGDGDACRLRARFPDCEVSVASSPISLSGFTVVVRRHAHPRARLWASLLALALVVVAFAALRLLGRGRVNDAGARGTI